MATVFIHNGSYRNVIVANQTLQLVQDYKDGVNGGFVTVIGDESFGKFANCQVRVRVSGRDQVEVDGVVGTPRAAIAKEPVVTETDEEAIERIRERFETLDEMADAAVSGAIRAMIVSGPPGVGKSFGVERTIEKATLFDSIAGKKMRSEVVKGSASAIGLYCKLYQYSDPNCVLVLDDADSILFDPVALNLLKGALDTGKKRKISWLSDSSVLRREGVPDSFNFNGSVIFITNLNFRNVKSKTLQSHLEALESRCHFVDLKIDSARDKILRIKQLVADGMLAEYDFSAEAEAEIIEFVAANKDNLRELSLRTVIKVAQLHKAFPTKWKSFAVTSILKAA